MYTATMIANGWIIHCPMGLNIIFIDGDTNSPGDVDTLLQHLNRK